MTQQLYVVVGMCALLFVVLAVTTATALPTADGDKRMETETTADQKTTSGDEKGEDRLFGFGGAIPGYPPQPTFLPSCPLFCHQMSMRCFQSCRFMYHSGSCLGCMTATFFHACRICYPHAL